MKDNEPGHQKTGMLTWLVQIFHWIVNTELHAGMYTVNPLYVSYMNGSIPGHNDNPLKFEIFLI